jgi:hypothetical protein
VSVLQVVEVTSATGLVTTLSPQKDRLDLPAVVRHALLS